MSEQPWLKTPLYGLLEIQLSVAPFAARAFARRATGHPVLAHLVPFVEHVRARVYQRGRDLGFVPDQRPGLLKRLWAMGFGAGPFLHSQFARSHSKLDKTYLRGLGFEG